MSARCGGKYGTRSTTPGTEITTDGVEAGEILVCELDAEPAHDIHRSGKWWWSTDAFVASDGPVPEPPAPRAFDSFAAEVLKDPAARASYEDAGNRHAVIDALFAYRKQCGLSQREVARRMDVSNSVVWKLEREDSNPSLSLIQRYARSVGLRILIDLVSDRTCRVCGCTDEQACPVGCAWVLDETDLCTSCTTDQGATAPPTSTAGGD